MTGLEAVGHTVIDGYVFVHVYSRQFGHVGMHVSCIYTV